MFLPSKANELELSFNNPKNRLFIKENTLDLKKREMIYSPFNVQHNFEQTLLIYFWCIYALLLLKFG
jgi:hypothetical protein